MPGHLGHEAESEWGRLVEELRGLGTLARADRAILETAATCYAQWREAEQNIASEGIVSRSPLGGLKRSPWVDVGREARRDYLRCIEALGLTPRARQAKPAEAEPKKDRLGVFIAEEA
jgi:P27 family predicted phage terminase small subunit